MIHEGRLFDFPGRNFTFQCEVDVARSALRVAAVSAFAVVVEPTVVECSIDDLDGNRAMHHLVSSPRGGAYLRDAARTTSVSVIDERTLVEWLERITERGAAYIACLSIGDGWYPVDAVVGDVIRLHETLGAHDVRVRDRDGVAAVSAPDHEVIVPPLALTLDEVTGIVRIALHWSPWIDRAGIGRKRFDRMCEQLASAHWKLVAQPAAEDLEPYIPAQEPTPVAAPLPVAPVRDRHRGVTASWVSLPATDVVLGITAAERERLADALLTIDRAAFDDEGSLGYREYDATKRRSEIVAGLAPSLGHTGVRVAQCEIMRRPVTNALWSAYILASGAARPSAWTATTIPPDDEPVAGISSSEAATFASYFGWSLPTEAEWQLAATTEGVEDIANGPSEYTSDSFEPYEQGDRAAFVEAHGLRCARGDAPGVPPCIPARRGLAADHRFKFARFRCVRRI